MFPSELVFFWQRPPHHNNPIRLRQEKVLLAVPAEEGRFLAKDFGWGWMLLLPTGEGFWEKSLRKG
jgi:hypothetical protein